MGDYVYLQQIAPTTLDVMACHIILRVQEVLASRVLMLEGHDGVVWKDHVCNCAPCHLPNMDGTVHPSLVVIWAGLKCMLSRLEVEQPICWRVIDVLGVGTWCA